MASVPLHPERPATASASAGVQQPPLANGAPPAPAAAAAGAPSAKATPPPSPEKPKGWRDTAWGLASGLWGVTKTAASYTPDLARGVYDISSELISGAKEIASGATEATLGWALLEKFLKPAMDILPKSKMVVKTIEGHELLNTILKQIVPDIAEFLAKANPGLKVVHAGAKAAMLEGIYAVLINAIARIIVSMPPQKEKDKKRTFFDVVGYALHLIEQQHDMIKERLAKAGSDKKTKDKILAELLQPILQTAFPKGRDSLGFDSKSLYADAVYQKLIGNVSLTDEAWNAIQEHLPVLVVNILNILEQRLQAQAEAMTKVPDGQMRVMGIKAVAPWIAAMAGRNEAIANSLNTHCPRTLIRAIEFCLTLVALNADKGTKKGTPQASETLSYLASLVQSKYNAMLPDIAEAELNVKESDAKTKVERNRHISAIFEPLLGLADPTAEDAAITEKTPAELMILQLLVKKIWTELKPNLPAVGVKVYDLAMDSQANVEQRNESLQTSEEGTALLSIAELMGHIVTSKLRTTPGVTTKATQLALARLPDRTKEMAAGEWDSAKKSFANFLGGIVTNLLGAKMRGLAPIMPLVQRRVTEISGKMFHHMINRAKELKNKAVVCIPTGTTATGSASSSAIVKVDTTGSTSVGSGGREDFDRQKLLAERQALIDSQMHADHKHSDSKLHADAKDSDSKLHADSKSLVDSKLQADSKASAAVKEQIDVSMDPISIIMTQFRQVFSEFYHTQSNTLSQEYGTMALLPVEDDRRKKWTAAVFGPLAKSLMTMTGLDKEPLFGLQETITENLPGYLFDFYGMIITQEPHLLLWINPQATVDRKRKELLNASPLGSFWVQVAERASHGILAQLPERLDSSMAHDIAQASVANICGKVNQHNVGLLVDDTLQKLQLLEPKWFDSMNAKQVADLRTAMTNDVLAWLAARVHHSDHPIATTFSAATKLLLAPVLEAHDQSVTKAFDAWFHPKLEAAVGAYLTPSSSWPKTIRDWLTDAIKTLAKFSASTLAREAIHELETNSQFSMWFANVPASTKQQVETLITNNVKDWLAHKNETTRQLVQRIFGQINHLSPTFAKTLPSNPLAWEWKWLEDRVQNLANEHAHIEPIWDFADAHLQGILLNSFARPDIGGIIGQCATRSHEFIATHGEAIGVLHVEIAKCNAKVIDLDTQLINLDKAIPYATVEKDRHELQVQKRHILALRDTHIAALMPLFQPLAADFIKLFGIDKEDKLKVFGADALITEKSAHAICMAYVEMMLPSEGYAVTFDRLCNLFFDQRVFQHKLLAQGIKPELVQLMSDPRTMPPGKRLELWNISEAAVKAKQVENFIRGLVSPYIRATVQDLAKKYDMQSWLRDSYDIVINPRQAELLRLELRKFADNKAIGDYLEQLINTTLPQAFVNATEAIEALQGPSEPLSPGKTPQHHLYTAPYAFVRRMLLIKDKHLAERPGREKLELRIEDAENELDPNVKREKLRNIFLPIAKEVLALVGNALNDPKHPAYHWPLPMGLKALFWNTFFPNMMADMMINGNKSVHWDTRQLKVQQEQLYGSKHPIVVAEVAGRFGQTYLPHTLSTQAPQRAHEMCNVVEVMTKTAAAGPTKEFHDFWETNMPMIEKMAAANLEQIGENREDAFKNLWESFKEKIESFALTAIGAKSNNLAKIAKNQPGFMMHMIANIMRIVDAHTGRVNEITRRHGKSHPYQVDPAIMRREFGAQLHEALRLPEGASKADADARKMEYFFKPMTEQLLKLAGVTPKMMPKLMFKTLKDTLAPLMFSMVYDSMWSRKTGKNMQITLVTKWREAIRTALQQQAAGVVVPPSRDNPVSAKDIEEFRGIIEPLSKELVDWLPGTLVNILINNLPGVHKLTSEMATNMAIGQAQQWTPIEIMRKILIVAGPSMQAASWNKRQPNLPDEMDPKDVFVPSAPIAFASTSAEKEKELRDQIERMSIAESEATSISVKLGIEGLNATIQTTARNKIWLPVAGGIDWASGKVFRSYGDSVANGLKLGLEYIGKILSYLLYPLYILLAYPLEWIHLSIQERNIDRSASHPIHEALFMSIFSYCLNECVAALEEIERKPVQEALKRDFNSVIEQLGRVKPVLREAPSPLKPVIGPLPAVDPAPSVPSAARLSQLRRSPQRNKDHFDAASVVASGRRQISAHAATRFAEVAKLLGSGPAPAAAPAPASALAPASAPIVVLQQQPQPDLRRVEPAPVSVSDAQISARAKKDGFISFYLDSIDPLTGFLGNFHICQNPIDFGGRKYSNSEAIFQSQKYTDQPLIFAQFNQATDGEQAFSIANNPSNKMTTKRKTEWVSTTPHVNSIDITMNILRAKFGQNPSLQAKLLATGNAYLVEHNPKKGRDNFWSDDNDGTGLNMLGVCLMRLRKEYGGTGEVPKVPNCHRFAV